MNNASITLFLLLATVAYIRTEDSFIDEHVFSSALRTFLSSEERHPLVVYYNRAYTSAPLEAALLRVASSSLISIILTSDPLTFSNSVADDSHCALIFIEEGDDQTAKLTISCYWNRFLREVRPLPGIPFDDFLLEVTSDLRGAGVLHADGPQMATQFFGMVANRLNSTIAENTPELVYGYKDMKFFTFEGHRRFSYMHSSSLWSVAASVLAKPKPLIDVLTDPFDGASWICCGLVLGAMAVLRTMIRGGFQLNTFASSFYDTLCSVTLGSTALLQNDLDITINNLFVLLNVVLLSAYESLVISFLQQPRFYPELDTVEQLNEFCMWVGKFPFFYDTFPMHRNAGLSSAISSGYPICYLTEPTRYGHLDPLKVYRDDHNNFLPLRKSKVQLKQVPQLALLQGILWLAERIDQLVAIFFDEAALWRHFEPAESRPIPIDGTPKPIRVDQLSLVWSTYLIGVGLCGLVFCVERLVPWWMKNRMSFKQYFQELINEDLQQG